MSEIEITEMKKPYAVWRIGDDEYKLKLKTAAVVDLETKYKVNLIDLLMVTEKATIPPLSVMLDVTHAALQAFHHGIRKQDVYELYDKYEENGGSQLKFFSTVFIELYTVSGFFGEEIASGMREDLKKLEDKL